MFDPLYFPIMMTVYRSRLGGTDHGDGTPGVSVVTNGARLDLVRAAPEGKEAPTDSAGVGKTARVPVDSSMPSHK